MPTTTINLRNKKTGKVIRLKKKLPFLPIDRSKPKYKRNGIAKKPKGYT